MDFYLQLSSNYPLPDSSNSGQYSQIKVFTFNRQGEKIYKQIPKVIEQPQLSILKNKQIQPSKSHLLQLPKSITIPTLNTKKFTMTKQKIPLIGLIRATIIRRLCYPFQILKQFFLFPDSQSQLSSFLISIKQFKDDKIIDEEVIHGMIKTIQLKQLSCKLVGFLNIKHNYYKQKISRFMSHMKCSMKKLIKRQKQTMFNKLKTFIRNDSLILLKQKSKLQISIDDNIFNQFQSILSQNNKIKYVQNSKIIQTVKSRNKKLQNSEHQMHQLKLQSSNCNSKLKSNKYIIDDDHRIYQIHHHYHYDGHEKEYTYLKDVNDKNMPLYKESNIYNIQQRLKLMKSLQQNFFHKNAMDKIKNGYIHRK